MSARSSTRQRVFERTMRASLNRGYTSDPPRPPPSLRPPLSFAHPFLPPQRSALMSPPRPLLGHLQHMNATDGATARVLRGG